MQNVPNADCGMIHLPAVLVLAVFIDETVMAKISSDSFIKDSSLDACTVSLSMSNSIQYNDSSVSSSTVPIFEMKSAVDLARHAAR